MRHVLLHVALALLAVAFASPSHAQEPVRAAVPAPTANEPAAQTPGLDARIERLDLREIALGEALRMLSEESGVNLTASEEAAKKSVSTLLQNISVRGAIQTLARSYGLWFREEDEVVRVMTVKEFERDLALFRDEKSEVFTLLYPNALDVAYAVRNLFGDRVRLTLDRDHLNDEYQEIDQRFQRFDLLDRRSQGTSVFGSGSGTNGNGGIGNSNNQNGYNQQSSNLLNSRNENGTQYGQQQDTYRQDDQRDLQRDDAKRDAKLTPGQVEELQRQLAAQAQGGEIDPALLDRLLGARTSIYVTVIRRNNTVAVRSSDRAALEEIGRLVKALDVPTPQVLLEIKVLSLDLGDDFTSAFDFDFADGNVSSRFRLGNIGAGTGLIDSGAFVFQYVNDTFQARVQFLQDRNRVNTLATPLLLVANNEVARLFIGEERPLVRNISSQTTLSDSGSVTTPTTTIEIKPVGTTLLLTPNVNADRTVTLRVLQENSEINPGGATIPVLDSDGNVTDQPIDTVRSRTITGTVVAKDGLTLALGGLIEEGITDIQQGIPGLMDIPILGALFRREMKSRSHSELIVLVRPYVLFTAAEGSQMSRELAGRLSLHPATETLGAPQGTYGKGDAPRAPLGKDPIGEMLKFQSGLPDGK